jgi:DNA-binding transcriptional MerR regulator
LTCSRFAHTDGTGDRSDQEARFRVVFGSRRPIDAELCEAVVAAVINDRATAELQATPSSKADGAGVRHHTLMDQPARIPDSSRPTLQIGDVAQRTNLSIRTIRHWEEMGLLRPSARTAGGFRLYSEEDVARVRLLRYMKPLKFTLEQMRELLELRESAIAGIVDEDERLAGLVWPRTGNAPDSATHARWVRDLSYYADQAERRLATLQQEVREVEEFVSALRQEARILSDEPVDPNEERYR